MNIIKLINENIFTILIALLISIAFFLQTYFEIEHLTNKEDMENKNIEEQVNQNTRDINKNDIQTKITELQSQIANIKAELNKTNDNIQNNYSEFKVLDKDYTENKQKVQQAMDASAKKTSNT
jgi:peptidoglycan hydrolase CwlO-like protein